MRKIFDTTYNAEKHRPSLFVRNMSGQIYGQAYEYLSVLRSTNQILNRITSDFDIDQMTKWRVLKHLLKIDF